MKVGLGLVTYKRSELAADMAANLLEMTAGVVDELVMVNDGGPAEHQDGFSRAFSEAGWPGPVLLRRENRGVAATKNECLRWLLGQGCDRLFLVEDDKRLTSPQAITGFLEASEETGVGHLAFNMGYSTRRVRGPIRAAGDHHGGFTFFTRRALLDAGLLDERLVNAFEHNEHALRLYMAGAFPLELAWPDVVGSDQWIKDRSLESSIERDWDGGVNESPEIVAAHAAWRTKVYSFTDSWQPLQQVCDTLDDPIEPAEAAPEVEAVVAPADADAEQLAAVQRVERRYGKVGLSVIPPAPSRAQRRSRGR